MVNSKDQFMFNSKLALWDMSVNTRRDRLRQLISEYSSISAFAKQYGFDATYLSQMLNGHRNIGEKTARKIESAAGKPALWLDGEGGFSAITEGVAFDNSVGPGPSIRRRIPLISWVQAGDWREASDPLQPGDAESWELCPRECSSRTYALRVRGESMSPRFSPGEIIMVDPEAPADSGRFVIAKKTGTHEVTFKQLVREGAESYLKATNPQWPEPIIRMTEDWIVCGVVICKVEIF